MWYVPNGGDRLLKVRSIITEVAIFPDPKRFFIPNSGNKNLAAQEELAKEDGQKLRERLGPKGAGLDVIIPDQASTLTELTFKYLDQTTIEREKVWLFGSNYGCRYGITKNPVYDDVGSLVAYVGNAGPDHGVGVFSWRRDNGEDYVRVVSLVVAKKK